jgi:hypothetical protein
MSEIKWVWDYQLLDQNPKREDSTVRHGVVQVIPFHLHHAALQTLRAENARLREALTLCIERLEGLKEDGITKAEQAALDSAHAALQPKEATWHAK